jgi:hypothetical protein
MNWAITLAIIVAIILLVYVTTKKETFDSRMIASTHRLTPHTYDAPLQPVLRGSYSSGGWIPEGKPYSKEYESNYHLDWLPGSLHKV